MPSSPTLTPNSAIGLNQPGIDGAVGGASPPDTTGAISPSNYIEMVNHQISLYSRATLASPPVATSTEDAFVGSTGTCDGQIKWDQTAQRFLYYSLDCAATSSNNGYSFGWSSTANPQSFSSGWCRYHVSTGSYLYDYGKLGHSDSFLILGVNRFIWDPTLSPPKYRPVDSPITTFPKPPLGSTTCPSITGSGFVPAAGNEWSPEPANIYGQSATGYVTAISLTSNTALRMFTITGSTTPVLSDLGTITVPAFNQPASIPQPGTTDTLDPSDERLTQATGAWDPTISSIGVWTQHTVAGSGGGPSVVRWYELKAGQGTPVQTGTVAVTGAFAFNGAIAPTNAGNAAAINYDVGSSTSLVQARAQFHEPGAALGVMADEVTLASSSGADNDFTCPSRTLKSGPCRWGDYAGASTDPSGCGSTIWGTNELNGTPDGAGGSRWTTQNFELIVPGATCPPTTTVIIPSDGATLSGTAATLDATASNATSVQFWLFGGSYGYSGHLIGTATLTIYGWLYSWNTNTVANGSYVLLSEAFNSSGSAFSSNVSVTVDNLPPPTTSVIIPSNGATLSGTAATLDASASNSTSVQFWLFGGSYGYSGHMVGTATLTYYGWLYSWNTKTVANGSYVLLSEAFNSSGSAFSPGVSMSVAN